MASNLNYRQMLRDEWESRRCRNSAYSMRSFARDLEVSPPFLSRVLSGAKGLSPDRADSIARVLNWTHQKRSSFVLLVRFDSAKSTMARTELGEEVARLNATDVYRPVAIDIFKAMSEWHHNAILELVTLEDFSPSPRWIARCLKIGEVEAAVGLERLQRLGLLRYENDRFVQGAAFFSTGDVPSESIRDFHKQMLLKAADALDTQSLDERTVSGVTVAIDVAKFPIAKEMIAKFRRDLVALMNSGAKQEVYHFAVQFFRLSASSPTVRVGQQRRKNNPSVH